MNGQPLWKRVAAGTSPILLLALLCVGLMWALMGPGADAKASALLGIAYVVLAACAVAVARLLFVRSSLSRVFSAAIVLVAIGWLWQRIAFLKFLPHDFLEYGFFITPAGKRPRFLILELPLTSVAIALFVLLLVAVLVAWWGGARWSLSAIIAWWFVLFVVFALPSLYLYLQGDAAIFI
jgi:hypothetical protein